MTTAKRTQRPTPPKAGTRPSVRVDDQLAADLAVVMRTGANLSDAVRQCVRLVADVYRTAWAEGVVPVGTAPVLLAYQLERDLAPAPPQPNPSDAMTSGYDVRRTPPAPTVGQPPAQVPGTRPSPRRPGPIAGLNVRQP
ncbi:hypothetical protein [Streptomyces sp. NBC_01268]|uniref:hypothetical protein n=1 Tax=Streptomyces sp. NBC_01268 TaxID=2903806 RepID=UPI002E2FCFB9|nr:hypothetical protein [Streptomyces sp. NBC_01268]